MYIPKGVTKKTFSPYTQCYNFRSMYACLDYLIVKLTKVQYEINNHYCSIGGAIMVVGGLYSVLWGKNREDADLTNITNEQGQERIKQEIIHDLECSITHH